MTAARLAQGQLTKDGVTTLAVDNLKFVEIQASAVEVILASPDGRRLVINDDEGQPLVTCFADGTVRYGAAYHPDAAARRFWSALASACPGLVSDFGQNLIPEDVAP